MKERSRVVAVVVFDLLERSWDIDQGPLLELAAGPLVVLFSLASCFPRRLYFDVGEHLLLFLFPLFLLNKLGVGFARLQYLGFDVVLTLLLLFLQNDRVRVSE